jgi:hypothetical protein
MKAKREPAGLLQQIAQIQRMERGKLCPMRAGAYYNHQTWEQGRNVVRYVARDRVASLQQAIAGYQQYLKLTQAYADEIIRRTRQAQPPSATKSTKTKKNTKNPGKSKN